ncbi:M20/M25/M40 family metallo-hydrolase [Streptomyces sp. NBC_00878]|uniref:M20/M25/M40 family metallo-hydrolase n=1 Tax=Streptomyces sp. NBC_00878 TaxID=2975854 RepID=UPI002253DC38|nr:M20/M25/M40 family metallo-hydrolase [Streptomyces sp. NBC_00878]MCX4910770.1 M20/M25/M40 family metallo-hydrolase [Streptomyces sp. NBC_00878]
MSSKSDEAVLLEAQRVRDASADAIDEILADVEDWVNHDSPTFHTDLVDQLADRIAGRATDYGLEAELLEGTGNGKYLHAALDGPGSAKVALLCHHDTVFAPGTAAARPYSRKEGRIYGPGVCDMKGGIAVALHAMRFLASGPRLFGRVELVSVPDEEEREGRPATIDRLKGFDAVLTLECGRADHSIVSSRKGGRWLEITAHGQASHAGVAPVAGRNAVGALAREISRLHALDQAREGLTVNLTALHGGASINTIPDEATMTYDIRGLTERDLEWVVNEITRYASHEGITFSDRLIGWTPPMERTAPVERLAAATMAIGNHLGLSFGEAATGGASDGSWTAHAGLPTLDGMGPTGDLDHTADEYAEVSTFAPRAGILAGLIADINRGLLK